MASAAITTCAGGAVRCGAVLWVVGSSVCVEGGSGHQIQLPASDARLDVSELFCCDLGQGASNSCAPLS